MSSSGCHAARTDIETLQSVPPCYISPILYSTPSSRCYRAHCAKSGLSGRSLEWPDPAVLAWCTNNSTRTPLHPFHPTKAFVDQFSNTVTSDSNQTPTPVRQPELDIRIHIAAMQLLTSSQKTAVFWLDKLCRLLAVAFFFPLILSYAISLSTSPLALLHRSEKSRPQSAPREDTKRTPRYHQTGLQLGYTSCALRSLITRTAKRAKQTEGQLFFSNISDQQRT